MDISHHIIDVQGCLDVIARGQPMPETPWDTIMQEHGPPGGIWKIVNRPLVETERPLVVTASGPIVHIPIFPYQVVPALECLLGFAFGRAALLFAGLAQQPRGLHLAIGSPVQTTENGAHRYWFGLAFKE
jgi:hypothetical protein